MAHAHSPTEMSQFFTHLRIPQDPWGQHAMAHAQQLAELPEELRKVTAVAAASCVPRPQRKGSLQLHVPDNFMMSCKKALLGAKASAP